MAGFPFAPFAFNIKCIVFSGAMVAAYMYLPCRFDRNWRASVSFIALASYVGLAWYDHVYDCDVKMRPGLIAPLTRYLKPALKGGVYGGD